MEELERLATHGDRLLACCLCNSQLQDPLQLTCLHNCCQLCFGAALSENNSRDVTCGYCDTKTPTGSELPNSFVDQQVQRNSSISESRTCGVCKENGEPPTAGLAWCPSCRHSLCGDCLDVHRQYYRKHVTESLEELESLEDLYPQSSASVCRIHTKPLEIACLSCEQAKCLSCWTECKSIKHEMHVFGDTSFDDYVNKFVSAVSSLEEELLSKSEVLEKPRCVLDDLKVSRARHLEQINQRKRLIVDAVEEAYQHVELAIKNTYDDQEKTAQVASACAERIRSNISDARNYTRWLMESNRKCEILNQQRVVRQRLQCLSTELDTVRASMNTIRAVNVDPSLPDNLVNVIKSWIGIPVLHTVETALADSPSPSQRRSPPQHFTFGVASATVQLPVECHDVALTKEGRLLLAAAEHGLLEFCSSSGRKLSIWLPSKFDGRVEEVQTVAALSDGRAAAGLLFGRSIVLLKRSQSTGNVIPVDSWVVVRSLEPMQWLPKLVSAHGEALAVVEYSSSTNRRLLLTSVSSSWRGRHTEHVWEYTVGGLAITARAVVTASSHRVKLSSDREAYVLDAYSVAKVSERLWRHQPCSTDEHLQGICTNSIGSVLYVALCRTDDSGGRVSSINMADGIELQRSALSFDSGVLLLPKLISLTDDPPGSQQPQQDAISGGSGSSSSSSSCVLAVLSWDPKTGQHRTVTVHRSI